MTGPGHSDAANCHTPEGRCPDPLVQPPLGLGDKRWVWLLHGSHVLSPSLGAHVFSTFALFGVMLLTSNVRVTGSEMIAMFGPRRIRTANIEHVEVTGPYHFIKSAGPRSTLVRHGLTFATNGERWGC